MNRTFDIIVTHERTDFDALASLLGAALLFADAYAVLPRQMNRNVREFLALYHNHFRFVGADDLPRGRVGRAFVVDARAANSPRGTQPDTEYIIIDHHALPAAAEGDAAGRKPRACARPAPRLWQSSSMTSRPAPGGRSRRLT